MSSAPSFWTALKKEALDKAERAVAELNELGFNPAWSRALPHPRKERHVDPLLQLQSAKPGTFPAPYLPFQNDPASRWQDAPVTKDQEAIHGRGTDGEASREGWIISFLA